MVTKVLPADYIRKWFYCDVLGRLWRIDSGTATLVSGTYSGKNKGRGVVSILSKDYLVSRVIYFLAYGVDPGEKMVDHIDRDPTNNRPANLRLVTSFENLQNRSNNKSGVIGVCYVSRYDGWEVNIGVAGTKIRLGFYKDFFEAVCVRKSAENKLRSGMVVEKTRGTYVVPGPN